MSSSFLSFPSAGILFRTAVTIFLTLWFLAYPFVTYCTGFTVEERAMELSIRQYYAFARLQELHAPQVLRLRYLDEDDPHSTVFVEVAPPSSFNPFLVVDAPPLFKPTTTRVADAVNIKVDASLFSAPRPGALPVHGPLRVPPLVFGLSEVVVFVLVGVAVFIETTIRSTVPSLVLAVHQFDPTCKTTQGEAADVVNKDEHESHGYDLATLFYDVSSQHLLTVTAFLSSDDSAVAAVPEPTNTATELDFSVVAAPNVVLPVPAFTSPGDSSPVVDAAPVESAERGSRPDRERVRTEVEAMPLRASERTRTAPGHQVVPISTSVPGAAVSRIVPLPPMRIPPVVQRPALAPVSPSFTSPATVSSPVASLSSSPFVSSSTLRANTTIPDIPGAILYQTRAPTSSTNVIYSTGPSPPSVQCCPRPQYNPQQMRRASKIVYHGRSDVPPRAASFYLPLVSSRAQNLPMGTDYQLLAAQTQYPSHFHHSPQFLSRSRFYDHHGYSGPAQHRALSAW